MTRDPVTATPDTTTEEAAQLMLTNGFRHLPVLEGRSLKGVVSIRDVLASGSVGAPHRSRSCNQAA
jgi:CBS domain-containing protein